MPRKIREGIVEVSKLLYKKGMVNAYEGNVSVIDKGKVYITPSAVCKGFLTEDMIVVTDLKGNNIEGSYKPSSEIKLHLAVYGYRSDIGAVVHAHSPYATAYAIANKPIETRAYPEMIMLYDKIPLAPYGAPSTDDIYRGVEKYLKGNDVVLLANHGVMSVGEDVYNAFFKLESVESMAKVLTLTKQLGGEKELSWEELKELHKLRETQK